MFKKASLNLFGVIFLTSLFFLLNNCDKKSCQDVICGFNQNCVNGNCFCLDGYEGANCDEQAWQKYVGTYQVMENCIGSTSTPSHIAFVSQGSFINELLISDFLQSGVLVPMNIFTNPDNQANTLGIDFSGGGGMRDILGQGIYRENLRRIELDLTYTQGFELKQCEVTFFKR